MDGEPGGEPGDDLWHTSAYVANMQRIVVAALSLLGIAALVIAQPVGAE